MIKRDHLGPRGRASKSIYFERISTALTKILLKSDHTLQLRLDLNFRFLLLNLIYWFFILGLLQEQEKVISKGFFLNFCKSLAIGSGRRMKMIKIDDKAVETVDLI